MYKNFVANGLKTRVVNLSAGLWLLIFSVALIWRAQNLDAFGLFNDEGAHLMWARLAVEDFPLYGETQAVQAPLFLEWVGLAFRLAGQSIQVGRWAMLLGFGLLAVSLSWLAYRTKGWLAAFLAMLLLGLAPLNFTLSRLVMAEVPATGLATLAVVLVILYLDKAQPGWLLASGLALGLSFITKALNPFVAVPIGLLLLIRPLQFKGKIEPRCGRPWSTWLRDGLLWGVGLLIPLIVPWFIYERAAMYNQLIAFRSDLRAAIPGSWAETWSHLMTFLTVHWGLWLLAGGGILVAVFRWRCLVIAVKRQPGRASNAAANGPLFAPSHRPIDLWPGLAPYVWLVWLAAGLAMLLWHAPLFAHHFVVLLPPLILLGAGFLAEVASLWLGNAPTQANRQMEQVDLSATDDHRLHSWGIKIALSLIVAVAALNLPSMIRANQKTAAVVTGGREQAALELLQAVSAPNDFLMGDSQLLIFMADRRTPPPLGDVALVAIKAGRQTSARMIELTQTYQAPAVVQWSLRLPWLPDYLAWIEANYMARREWDNDHIIYFAPRFPTGQAVPNQRPVRLGEAVVLYGYEIENEPVQSGRALSLKIYWQAEESLPQDYTIFTQLLDGSGARVAGWDSQPLGGHFPTSQWPPGEIVTDIVQLPLPPDLPPGEYTLITGMYPLDTLERLPTSEGGDQVVLTPITVTD